MGSLLKEMTATIHEEGVDLVVLDLRKRSFPNLGALKLVKMIRSLRCPVLLDPPVAHDQYEPGKRLLWFQPKPEETTA